MSGLYLISPERVDDVELFVLKLVEIFNLKCKPDLFQLRIKNASLFEMEALLVRVRFVCEKYGVEMILNDSIELALKYGVGVHVGSSDASLQELEFFKKNSGKMLGVSCYNSFERAKMFENVADYVSFGAMFQSVTKKNAPVCDKSTIVEFAKVSSKPISIIGGITAENIEEIADILYFVKYVCVISEVWGK